MGITGFSFSLLEKHGATKAGLKMLELGDQNIYFGPEYGKFAKPLFIKLGLEHTSLDLSSHEGGAVEFDLSKPSENKDLKNKFDVVTNFGTSEHISSLYNCLKNIHEFCKKGGLIFHENPKTGNWPGHGFHYFTEKFYLELADKMEYKILEIGEHPAMGNQIDGWNIFCVLQKSKSTKFISEEEFNLFDFRKS